MEGRIYTCYHYVPPRVINTSLFATFLSGAHSDAGTGLVGDLDGANIASPNLHSEMRHQYHVWQERLAGMDYVGFEHHRRIFYINPLSAVRLRSHDPRLTELSCLFASDDGCVGLRAAPDAFVAYLDLREAFTGEMKEYVDRLMTNNDIVTQRPHAQRLDEQFIRDHSPSQWGLFVDVVRQTRFFTRSAGLIDFSLRSPTYCNMYIMRTEIFLEYMELWWECMQVLETLIEPVERYFGYFAERLANLFVYGKRLQDPAIRVNRLPFIIDGACG